MYSCAASGRACLMDYEIQRCTRHCAATGRELNPGETYYSAIVEEGPHWKRLDFSVEAWNGPPEGAIGWWKSQVLAPDSKRPRWAPNDLLVHFFEQLEGQPDREDVRYLLALLLVRRRVMRLEEEVRDAQGRETLVVYCPRRDATYRVPVVMPDDSRLDLLQDELARLLFSNAA